MSASIQNKISVIVPAKNEQKHIGECLNSLLNQEIPEDLFEVIVVDNGSTDNTVLIASSYDRVKVVSAPNLNVGAVRNIGANEAVGEFLAFIDADCVAPNNWLLNIHKHLKVSSTIVGGGAMLPHNPDPIERFWLLEGPNGHNIPRELIGATFAVSKANFESVGGFDESVTSGEDSDLSMRFRAKGFKVLISRDFSVIHLGNAKTSIDFIKRQIWHSENYLKNAKSLFKDPVFITTLVFTILFYINLFLALNGEKITILLMAQLAPVLPLTAKRILRSKYNQLNILNFLKIAYLDFIYLIGRSIGLHKSLLHIVRRQTKI